MAWSVVHGDQRDYIVGFVAEKAWMIWLTCEACARQVRWPVADYTVRFPAEATMGQIADRLVCECGSNTGQFWFQQDHAAEKNRRMARLAVASGQR